MTIISILVPPVLGIYLFISKYKAPEYKITLKDIFLLFIYSLPIVAPIAGFIMDYKASKENQERKAKNLADRGSENEAEVTIDNKMIRVKRKQQQQKEDTNNSKELSVSANEEEK